MRPLQHALKRRYKKPMRFCGKLKPPPNTTMTITGTDIIILTTVRAQEPTIQAIIAITWACIANIIINTDAIITNTGTIRNTAVMVTNMGTITSTGGIPLNMDITTNTGDTPLKMGTITSIDQEEVFTIATTAAIASGAIIP